jgi:hypothetical protein
MTTRISLLEPLVGAVLAIATIALPAGAATTFNVSPLDLGDGYTVSGTVTTDGATGALVRADLTAWNLRVTHVERLATYTPANTVRDLVGIGLSGGTLTVATSPDGTSDGGQLQFRLPSPFVDLYAQIADFTLSSHPGGQASFAWGSASGSLALGQPNGTSYVAGTQRPADPLVFDLVTLDFGAGVTLSGTVTANAGLTDIIDWNIAVTSVTTDIFNQTNSSVNLFGLLTDGREITVALPPSDYEDGGYWSFRKRREWVLQLADFTSGPLGSPTGAATYVSPLGAYQVASPLLADPSATRYVAARVPEPATAALIGLGLLLVGLDRRHRRRTARGGQARACPSSASQRA